MALSALGVLARPGAADDPPDESLRDLVTRLLAEVQMLADKVDRLDRRMTALEARGTAAASRATPIVPPIATSPGAPRVAGTRGPTDALVAGAVPPSFAPSSVPSTPEQPALATEDGGGQPSEDMRLPDVSSRQTVSPGGGAPLASAPRPDNLPHASSAGAGYIAPVDKTFVRLAPESVGTSVPEIDLSLGAVLSYPGQTPRGLPESVSLDGTSTWPGWNAYSDRDVVVWADSKRYALGEAGFRQATKDGQQVTTFTIGIPRAVVQAIAKATDVVATIGHVEFGLPASVTSAIQGGPAALSQGSGEGSTTDGLGVTGPGPAGADAGSSAGTPSAAGVLAPGGTLPAGLRR